VAGVDAALLAQIVFELLQDQRLQVPARLVPVRGLAGLETDELDGETRPGSACQSHRDCPRVILVLLKSVLELVIGQRLDLAVVALGDRLEQRSSASSRASRCSTTAQVTGPPSS
jgi:hypothetical protein